MVAKTKIKKTRLSRYAFLTP